MEELKNVSLKELMASLEESIKESKENKLVSIATK